MSTKLSIVMPCLNEQETLAKCIEKALLFFEKSGLKGEIIIADNGSNDGSQDIAKKLGANVINVFKKGYGSALQGGIAAANGQYIIMGDADNSYDFSSLERYVAKLDDGFDLVLGNRFKGGIQKNAMPLLHKYLGNPVLSFIGRLFFKSNLGDFHCGLRGFTKVAYQKMQLSTTGMEFASEMIVKSHLLKLKITEVPTILYKDGRSRPPHLKTWSDGWRHLRFLLLYSPKWLFLQPGIFLMIFGFFSSIALIVKPIKIFNVVFDVHTLLFCNAFFLVGFQFVVFYGFTKVVTVTQKLLPKSKKYDTFFKIINLEKGLLVGAFFVIAGLGLSFYGLKIWSNQNYGTMELRHTLRIIIPAITTIVIGIQIILFSFFFSILGLKK